MTTYSYTITIGDSEHIALEAALLHFVEHCAQQISAGAGALACPEERYQFLS